MDKTIVRIQEDDKEIIALYVDELNKYEVLQESQKERYEHAQRMVQKLYEATARLYRLNVDDDIVTCRNAEILTHFLNEARDSNEKIALYGNIQQALREGLSLFFAETYNINMGVEWRIDVEQGALVHAS